MALKGENGNSSEVLGDVNTDRLNRANRPVWSAYGQPIFESRRLQALKPDFRSSPNVLSIRELGVRIPPGLQLEPVSVALEAGFCRPLS